ADVGRWRPGPAARAARKRHARRADPAIAPRASYAAAQGGGTGAYRRSGARRSGAAPPPPGGSEKRLAFSLKLPGVVDDAPEDGADQLGIDDDLPGVRRRAPHHLGLARGIQDGNSQTRLDLADLFRERQAAGQQPDELVVRAGDLVAELLQPLPIRVAHVGHAVTPIAASLRAASRALSGWTNGRTCASDCGVVSRLTTTSTAVFTMTPRMPSCMSNGFSSGRARKNTFVATPAIRPASTPAV